MPLFGIDWRKSAAHKLLLTKFIGPHLLSDYTSSEPWKQVLRESPQKAILRFEKEGVLVRGSLPDCLDASFTLTELKDFLRARQLKVSGKKEDLIARLVDADPDGMKKAVGNEPVFVCSPAGLALATEIKHQIDQLRNDAEQQTIVALVAGNYYHAGKTVAAFEARQVFPRGLGIQWDRHDPNVDKVPLQIIMTATPLILKNLPPDQIQGLRIPAAMMYLWGTSSARKWFAEGFIVDSHMDRDAAARMLVFYARHKVQLAQYKKFGQRIVCVFSANDCCTKCRPFHNKVFPIDKLPEFPYEHCTDPMGCRCTLAPYVEGMHSHHM